MAAEERETLSLIGSDKVEGTAVYGADETQIGSIERVMIDKRSGKVSYAVLSFGGFLGIGDDYYPLPWESLKYDKLAVGAGECLMFVSLVGDTGIIKGIRASLNTNKKVTITANGGRVKRATAHESAVRDAGAMTRAGEGFRRRSAGCSTCTTGARCRSVR